MCPCISGEKDKKNDNKKNTAHQVQPGQNLLYGNQIRLNSPASKQAEFFFFFFFSPDGTDRRADRSLCRIFWCSRVASRPLPLLLGDTESKGCKSTHFLPPLPSPRVPPPSANTDSRGPVPGLSICRTSDRSYASFSPCSLPNKLQGSPSLGCMHGAV